MVDDLVLRKYQHRRFYDAKRSRFVRLTEIAELIREGAQVTARDRHGADITAELLARIIIHQQANTKAGPLTTQAMRTLVLLIVSEGSSGLPVSLGSVAAFLEAIPMRTAATALSTGIGRQQRA